MSSIQDWFRKQATALALATSKVEKNALGQEGKPAEDLDATGVVQPNEQGSLMESLRQGQVNEQVREFRWRMYKVVREADRVEMAKKYNARTGSNISKDNINEILEKARREVKLEPSDSKEFELDVVFKNRSSGDKWGDEYEEAKTYNSVNDIIKDEKPLVVERGISPSFNIEKYVDSVYIRNIDGTHKLIEFFIPKYAGPENKMNRMFLNQLKKMFQDPKPKDFLELDKIGFITNYSSIGVEAFKSFSYHVDGFYKIVEYGSYYVVKFYGTVETEDEDLFEQYRHQQLDEKYERKEAKNNPIEMRPEDFNNPNRLNG